MSPNGIDFIWGGTGPYHMELFLEFVGPSGETSADARRAVNCVACHIPYAFLDPDDVDPAAYFRVCLRIAAHLGWRVYDPQGDHYVDAV